MGQAHCNESQKSGFDIFLGQPQFLSAVSRTAIKHLSGFHLRRMPSPWRTKDTEPGDKNLKVTYTWSLSDLETQIHTRTNYIQQHASPNSTSDKRPWITYGCLPLYLYLKSFIPKSGEPSKMSYSTTGLQWGRCILEWNSPLLVYC